jgi:hypothetical protein
MRDDSFVLDRSYLIPWDCDLDACARHYAAAAQDSGLSAPLIVGAINGIVGMSAAWWHTVEGRSVKEIMAREHEWRRLFREHAFRIAAESGQGTAVGVTSPVAVASADCPYPLPFRERDR